MIQRDGCSKKIDAQKRLMDKKTEAPKKKMLKKDG